jgi:NAD(P)-dependent dehydrogenase (short-subunit alcohol dehydrogenase family)
LHLAKLGADVVFHGRRADLLEQAVAAAGGGHAVVADLENPDACAKLVETAVEYLGQIDLIVHAASMSNLAVINDLDGEAWAGVYAINVIAPALVVRAAIPYLSSGAICAFLSSESVGQPYHGLIPYISSKAALEEMIRGLRLEHPEFRFTCVRVGQTTPTDITRSYDLALAAELFPKWIAHGRITAQTMDVVEVGSIIASSLNEVLGTPTVEMQDLVLRPPGGILSSDAAAAVANIAALQESAEPHAPEDSPAAKP